MLDIKKKNLYYKGGELEHDTGIGCPGKLQLEFAPTLAVFKASLGQAFSNLL